MIGHDAGEARESFSKIAEADDMMRFHQREHDAQALRKSAYRP